MRGEVLILVNISISQFLLSLTHEQWWGVTGYLRGSQGAKDEVKRPQLEVL